jgi:hypothetical protein
MPCDSLYNNPAVQSEEKYYLQYKVIMWVQFHSFAYIQNDSSH